MSSLYRMIRGKIYHKIKIFLPQKFLVKHYYYKKTGRTINLSSPERFSDKLGWYKLYYRDEMMRTCTDKASVRDYVRSVGLSEILNECYGIYDNVEDINWSMLPQRFVLKNTLGGANNGILLVFDKNTLNLDETKRVLKDWIKKSSDKRTTMAGEWVYERRKARIIAEKMLIPNSSGDLPDYKFFCFNGKVFCSYLMRNYTMHPHEGENAFLDRDFKLLPVSRTDYRRITEQPLRPLNYEKMVEIAETLSKRFPHVRVDLYNIDGKIIFGELTFFTNSGLIPFDPDEFDYKMGKAFVLPQKNYNQ